MLTIGIDELERRVGEELGTSPWLEIAQQRIDAFADATDDRQWIHVDPARAAAGPYGATIAHGFLTLSLLPALAAGAYAVHGASTRVNYGLDRVRFPAPVRVGSRIRGRISLVAAERTDRGVRATLRTEVEIEGSDKPACVADSVTLFVRGTADEAVGGAGREGEDRT
ncbi:MAG: MaoC family dehydratase [Microbacteriaceae bacterium]|nr:MaoC family dehydratase [Microbacteriaceae bacterium]